MLKKNGKINFYFAVLVLNVLNCYKLSKSILIVEDVGTA